jgi:UDP-N-acetylglucosamine diphosphorylase/glucosamine-1-phosphate N-acetyltransferase
VTSLFLYDDAVGRAFEPFALTRPCSELLAGTHLVRERWEVALGMGTQGALTAAHLARFEEFGAARCVSSPTDLAEGSIVANARFACALARVPAAGVWTCGDRVAAVRLSSAVRASHFDGGEVSLESLAASGSARVEIRGWWLDHVWDLIGFLGPMLQADLAHLLGGPSAERSRLDVLGTHPVVVEEGAQVDPQVVFDVREGPILVRRGATIAPFTRLVGPCAIGVDARVLGAKVAASTIGDACRVHGEVSASVFFGYCNKAHDGFVGHSVLGRWANLGASTVTSNLKNTYGTVSLWTPSGLADSGRQFLGSLIGDHAKTAIGTRLTTGCVVGAGANVVLDGISPKVIDPFSWGGAPGAATFDIDKFLVTAERAMARRGVTLADGQRECLRAAFQARWRSVA